MQYSLMIYQTDAQFAARNDLARRDANTGALLRCPTSTRRSRGRSAHRSSTSAWSKCGRHESCRPR